ncbi:MAG TPA: IS256 family transposase [Clostridiaceae bacterium]|nr:IS256 family transposase [Clostridiaceae bacterium]
MSHFTTSLMELLYQGESIDEIIRVEIEKAVNELLQHEMTALLTYEKYEFVGYGTGNSRNGQYERQLNTRFGTITVVMPRDRNGEFSPVTIAPYQRSTDELESMVIKLYQQGMTTREIAEIIERMYGAHYSPQTISNMSQAMDEQVRAFHSRPVQAHYTVLLMDATWLNVRRDSVAKEAVHIIVGITPEGHKEVLDYAIFPSESSNNYQEMCQSLKERGLERVDLFVSDGLTGIRDACLSVFPKARHQSCWVHIARTVARCVRVSDRKEILDALKQVYQADDAEGAKEALTAFLDQYSKRYPKLREKLSIDDLSLFSFYEFDSAIRRSIYTTNLLEGFNKQLKRLTKRKEQFPNEASLDRFLCTVCLEYNRKFSARIHKGFGQLTN